MSDPQIPNPDAPLIQKLVDLHRGQDRGSLAALRGYWSGATRHRAWPVFGRLINYRPDQHGHAYYVPEEITAALFAMHGRRILAHASGSSVGSCALQVAGGRTEAPAFEAFERHFRRLLASDTLEDLAEQLLALVKRADRVDAPLDYNRLLWDLRTWNRKADDIKTRWAMDFWQAPAELAPSAK